MLEKFRKRQADKKEAREKEAIKKPKQSVEDPNDPNSEPVPLKGNVSSERTSKYFKEIRHTNPGGANSKDSPDPNDSIPYLRQ